MKRLIQALLLGGVVFVVWRIFSLWRTGTSLPNAFVAGLTLPIDLLAATTAIAIRPAKWGGLGLIVSDLMRNVASNPTAFRQHNTELMIAIERFVNLGQAGKPMTNMDVSYEKSDKDLQ